MHYYHIALAILLLPLSAFVLIALFNRVLPRSGDWIGVGAITIAAVLAVGFIFLPALQGAADWPPDETQGEAAWLMMTPSAQVGPSSGIWVGLLLDNLTACMLVVVTVVSACVHWFSLGYMADDRKYGRYFASLSLFTTSMLGLILSDNLLTLYVSWEIMGLASYLLIGHFFWKKSAADAALKAFITTRLGDIGMFIGIMLIYWTCGSFNFREIFQAVADGQFSDPVRFWAAMGLFFGAMGKSAQFPLHVWLPDAMEGPTPVSALIHAATMVAAGVYLVGRMFVFFPAEAFIWVAFIGAFTAIFSATIALVQDDIKKVLAYSTVSQLGYMMLGLGVGGLGMHAIGMPAGAGAAAGVMAGYAFGMHHLFTHAFFKAGLFLGSGSVIHAMHHEQSMSKYGGLVKKLPLTFTTFLICTLALTGFPYLFSGFFSKDGIIAAAVELNMRSGTFGALRWLATIAACLTAFYMFRLIILTFFGKPQDQEKHDHAHESPWVMTVPLIILAGMSLWFCGMGLNPLSHGDSWFKQMNLKPYGYEIVYGQEAATEHEIVLAAAPAERDAAPAVETANDADAADGVVATAGGHGPDQDGAHDPISTKAHKTAVAGSIFVFFLGLVVAIALYSRRFIKPETLANAPLLADLHRILFRKYYIDELYQVVFIDRTIDLCRFAGGFDMLVIDFAVNFWGWFYRRSSDVVGWCDNTFVDGAVNYSGYTTGAVGRLLARLQTGCVRTYILSASIGVAVLALVFVYLLK
ncbi:proton-conducting transporter membrane subunit [Candidatus Sumerlaeota bacterium]